MEIRGTYGRKYKKLLLYGAVSSGLVELVTCFVMLFGIYDWHKKENYLLVSNLVCLQGYMYYFWWRAYRIHMKWYLLVSLLSFFLFLVHGITIAIQFESFNVYVQVGVVGLILSGFIYLNVVVACYVLFFRVLNRRVSLNNACQRSFETYLVVAPLTEFDLAVSTLLFMAFLYFYSNSQPSQMVLGIVIVSFAYILQIGIYSFPQISVKNNQKRVLSWFVLLHALLLALKVGFVILVNIYNTLGSTVVVQTYFYLFLDLGITFFLINYSLKLKKLLVFRVSSFLREILLEELN